MIEVKNLDCGYGKKTILQDMSFQADKGEFVGIIGPNGSGKTTFLRALSHVLKPQKGCVLINGQDLASIKNKDLAKQIAVVPQSFDLNHISVEDFVLLGRIPHFEHLQFFEKQKDILIAKKAMERTDTYQHKDKLFDQISGGERQLALIARALTQEPQVLLLDEPTAHLDISHQVKVLDLLKTLNKELGLTVIMVLHDLNLASEYCDRLILIHQGRIHKKGTPQEVLDYRIIEDVYDTCVVVEDNPVSSKPCVLIVSEEARKRAGGA